jgi:hypothetical protein
MGQTHWEGQAPPLQVLQDQGFMRWCRVALGLIRNSQIAAKNPSHAEGAPVRLPACSAGPP